jgi:hypothetical protein
VTTASRSGLRVTAPIGVQSRVQPDQRAGLRSRAWTYTSCRVAFPRLDIHLVTSREDRVIVSVVALRRTDAADAAVAVV